MNNGVGDGEKTPLKDLPAPEMFRGLLGLMPIRVIEYCLNEEEVDQLSDFEVGANDDIGDDASTKLRELAEFAETVDEASLDPETVMFGSPRLLDGEAPATLFRRGEGPRVLAALPHITERGQGS